ncbi:hypothetical protein [Pseudodesulfovibrio mercurii]|uniref:hypothetical protein n=1 Tax=Pseudodesulfovibrio mercurii TaxID=641491 RepID=UPI0002F6CD43|nr:hypothetical protein [Pseudodesulfovibrio mercurii]
MFRHSLNLHCLIKMLPSTILAPGPGNGEKNHLKPERLSYETQLPGIAAIAPIFTRYAGLIMYWTVRFFVNRNIQETIVNPQFAALTDTLISGSFATPGLAFAAEPEYRTLGTGYGPP